MYYAVCFACVSMHLFLLQHFALMDSSEHRIFLAVNHSDGTHIYLYISDESGLNYTFSLDDIVTSDDWEAAKPSFDIHPVL